MAELVAVCRVHQLLPDAGTVGVTAIDKRAVAGRVKAGTHGLYADVQADRVHHGGPEQAVYAYAEEDARFWAAELGREITPGLFGENLRTRGLDVGGALIGERWRVGSAVLEVTQPRTPCATFARRLGSPERWVRRFTEANRTGAYLRVVETGELGAGDAVEVVSRPTHGVSVADWFGAWNAGPEGFAEAARLASALRRAADDGELRPSEDMDTRMTKAMNR
ncbi:MOSC domain-containing protein [Isoptericola sediminis]|uniref:MOSC domain-containing protein n=1 Tax=Isoptericola sediminis TaxID=2733572 RepID=A0A849JTC7_9MICO|nr:MOSC domain-containing protein [Isoptericola sediminis]NNU26656.1 MOSC domain-containing protein [Isoptericola sediminis]